MASTSGSFQTGYYGNRCIQFNWWLNGQDTSGDYSDIGWNLVGAGGGTNYYVAYNINGYLDGSNIYSGSNVNLWNGTVLASGTKRIYHNDIGNRSFGASASAGIFTYAVNVSGSGSWDLQQIPRQATITSANDFTDEGTPYCEFTNKGGFTTDIYLEATGLTTIMRTGVSSPYTFTLTDTERNNLRTYCNDANSKSIRYVVRTNINGTYYYSTLDKTLSIVNANPTFTDDQITYKDSNSTIVAITGDNQSIVRNNSNLQVTYTGASALKNATITNYEITFNQATQTKTEASTIDYGIVNLSNNSDVSIKVTDSRGNTTTIKKTITIYDWDVPVVVISANRQNNYEDLTYLKAQVTIKSVNGKNSIKSLQYRYKKTTDTDFGSLIDLTNNTQTTVSVDKLYAWNFQVIAKDQFGSTTVNFTILKGMPIMFYDIDKLSVGINCFPTNSGVLCVNGSDFLEYDVIEEWTD